MSILQATYRVQLPTLSLLPLARPQLMTIFRQMHPLIQLLAPTVAVTVIYQHTATTTLPATPIITTTALNDMIFLLWTGDHNRRKLLVNSRLHLNIILIPDHHHHTHLVLIPHFNAPSNLENHFPIRDTDITLKDAITPRFEQISCWT